MNNKKPISLREAYDDAFSSPLPNVANTLHVCAAALSSDALDEHAPAGEALATLCLRALADVETVRAAMAQADAPADAPSAVLTRVRAVVAAFEDATGAFPAPMPEADKAALLGASYDDVRMMRDPLPAILSQYGVSLDWLWTGDVRPLLIRSRIANQEKPE